ncbi:site-specific integrase [Cellulomonas sp.]|uniref:site-specific integrase n=1 Tax=Cellulomonas sp. TaxID=40001 RepID=UPI001AFE7FA8|nr:site-specific integrase [Cellulomonas sp.]MBO9555127.1 site-specific integrase [Cellulomonas sp.]
MSTPLHVPAPEPRPAGLDAHHLELIAAAARAATAPSTREAYASAWRQWAIWCDGRRITALPADPLAVCGYLVERAEQGVSISTIDLACAAISHRHQDLDLPTPVGDEIVRRVRRGLRRTIGVAPRRRAHPLSTQQVRRLVLAIDPSARAGRRDRALILLGFAGALRRSELAALRLDDVRREPGGLVLTVRRSKTDAYAHGEVVAVASGSHPDTDPVTALADWIELRGAAPGPLFTSVRHGGAEEPISGSAVARMLRRRAQAAGMPERITGHSLRAGHATEAARGGVSLERIVAQTRHRHLAMLIEHYIRPESALRTTSSRALGL